MSIQQAPSAPAERNRPDGERDAMRPAAEQSDRLAELARRDHARRWEAGEPLIAGAYTTRFPDQADAIERALFAPPEAGGLRYTLLRGLAAGNWALVCLARDNRDDCEVVVRFPHSQLEEAARQFQRESELLARLKHPLIVPLLDYFERAGRPFMVLEYIDGQTLAQKLKASGPLSPSVAARIMEQVSEAVDHVHECRSPEGKQLIHRDLKPAHVILRHCDGAPRLIDFGLAAYQEDASGPQSAAHGGTLEYMSPEQASAFIGEGGQVDRRSDVWALGAVLFELLTAERLFQTRPQQEHFASAAAWSEAISSYLSPRTSTDCASLVPPTSAIPAPLHEIIQRCVEKRAEARYQTAGELAEALRRWRESAADAPLTARSA